MCCGVVEEDVVWLFQQRSRLGCCWGNSFALRGYAAHWECLKRQSFASNGLKYLQLSSSSTLLPHYSHLPVSAPPPSMAGRPEQMQPRGASELVLPCGRETEVCSQVIRNSRKLRPRFADKTEQSTMRRVQYLVNMGLVSKACQALCSRGTTEITPENLAKVQGLFPPKRECNLFSTNQPSRSHYQPRQSQIGGPEIREGVVTETNWLAS